MTRAWPAVKRKPAKRRYWDDAIAKRDGEGRCRLHRLRECEGKLEV